MKSFFLFVIVLLSTSNALEVCSIIEPNKVLCKDERDYGTITFIFRKSRNENWVGKTYYPRTEEKRPAVFVDNYGRLDYEKICNEVNGVGSESIKFDCDEVREIWNKKVSKGEDFSVPTINFSSKLGKRKPISAMHCLAYDYVRTYKYNNVTGLETDRKDYFGLKPGTYCEDFLANDDLYWKPPKSR